MARELIFPEKMAGINPSDSKASIRTMDDYIRYMVERIDYAFTNYTTKDNFQRASKIVADSIFATNIKATTISCDQLNGGTIRGQRIISKNGTFKLEADGTLYAENATIRGDVEASSMTADLMETVKLEAEEIAAGKISALEIDASKITSGTIGADRLDADVLKNKLGFTDTAYMNVLDLTSLKFSPTSTISFQTPDGVQHSITMSELATLDEGT